MRTIFVSIIAILLTIASGSSLSAQAAIPTLTARQAGSLPSKGLDIQRRDWMRVNSRGEILLLQFQGQVIQKISGSGTITKWPDVIGHDPGAIFGRGGFFNDTFWVSNLSGRFIAEADSDGRVIKRIPYPSVILGLDGNRHAAPEVAGILPLAILPGGDLVAIPVSLVATSFGDLLPPGQDGTPILVVDRGGQVKRVLGVQPPQNQCRQQVQMGDRNGEVVIPFCPHSVTEASPDGTRLISVTTADPLSSHPRVTAVAVSLNGDTLFKRVLPYQPIPLPAAVFDGVAKYSVVDRPATYPMYRTLIAGRDGSTWIERWTTDGSHEWFVLDAKGSVAGSVQFPKDFLLQTADRSTAWGFQPDSLGMVTIVWYRIGTQ